METEKNLRFEASIIIPTFNRSKLLVNCVKTLLTQSFSRDYEIIIIDNNSTDDTYEQYILNFGDLDIVKYHRELRPGLVFSRHLGMKNARSKILIFGDDDAEYNFDCIESIVKVYEKNNKVVAVGGKITIKWDHEPPDWIRKYEPTLGKLDYGPEVIYSNQIYINGGLFSIKKDILIELGGFCPDQVGEFLVGDGETGLCKKIHNRKMLIGWTPDAIMQHIQFVNKNATVQDIGRRYFNNGIGKSYGLFSNNNFIIGFQASLNFLLKFALILLVSPFAFFSKKYFFYKSHFLGELEFYRMWTNKHYKDQVLRNNWF